MLLRVAEVTRSQFAPLAVDFIFSTPVFSGPRFMASSGIPRDSAARILRTLVDASILTVLQRGAGRSPTIYAFSPLLEIVDG
jgi:hypothetical protein